jgi:hypothetical protein
MDNFEFKPIPELKKQEDVKIQTNNKNHKTNKTTLASEPLVMLNVRIEKNLMDLMSDFAYCERYTKREIVAQALEDFLANKTIKSRSEATNNKNRRRIN